MLGRSSRLVGQGRLHALCIAMCLSSVLGQAYDPAEARVFASLAQAAYCGRNASTVDELLQWSCGPCLDSGLKIVPGSVRATSSKELGAANASFAYTARLAADSRFGDSCVLSIRGTASPANWAKDFQVWKQGVPIEDCEGCRAEHGFYTVWKGIKTGILAALADVGCVPSARVSAESSVTTNKLLVTGHSLGGAVSTLALLSLSNQGYDVRTSFVFESPRVGNHAFAQAFWDIYNESRPVWRITRARDPVPLVPPRVLGYRHISFEVYYNSSGDFHICNSSDLREDPTCADQHGLPPSLLHVLDHCASSLTPSGRICGCAAHQGPSSSAVIV